MKITNFKPILSILMVLFGVYIITATAAAESLVKEPVYSVPAGLYTEEFELTLTTGEKDATIYYTLDGSIPVFGNETTYEYTTPIQIKFQAVREQASNFYCGTVVRAVTITAGGNKSDVATASYFLDSDILNKFKLPIISITTDSENLYGNENGIMSPYFTQYRGKEWERPIHFEYFDKEGKQQISMEAGIRLHGGASRDWAFKSFRIYARSEYDINDQFDYDFFSNSVIPALVENGENKGEVVTEFKRLILRNGGNEGTAGDGILFRDALSQALMANTTLDLQAYSPAVTFLNGEFYGIQNIRERQDEKYIEDHYNVDESNIIIYEFKYDEAGTQSAEIVNGEAQDTTFYNNMVTFIRDNDMSVQANYEQVKQWLDIENFVDYQIINIYGANRDWPGNNSKAWRVRTDFNPEAPYGLDGRVRWLVYDMDFNFGLYNPRAVYMNSLEDATKAGGVEWPLQDGATLLLRKLLENEEFKTYFCQRFLDLLNTNFDKDYVNAVIDTMASEYEASIEEFKDRYRLLHDWNRNLETVKNFVAQRDSVCKTQLTGKFDLGKLYFLSINTLENSVPLQGKVNVNTVTIDSSSSGVIDGVWKKSFYEKLPVILTAIPMEGYQFVSWSGASSSTEPSIDASTLLNGGSAVSLTPVFELIAEEKAPTDSEIGEDNEVQDNISQTNVEKSKDNMIYILSIVVLIVIIALMGVYWFLRNKKEKK